MPLPQIPITIGVIGHLDAIITLQHVNMLNEFWANLRQHYPSSPLRLFTQLAEGADIAVAQNFIEYSSQNGGDHKLIVPLPFDQGQYLNSFDDVHQKAVSKLLDFSERTFVLQQMIGQDRDEMYRNGGQFVADSSIVLLAFWDGEMNGKMGGTADLVYYKQYGYFPDTDSKHLFDQPGIVMKIPCNREGQGSETLSFLEGRTIIESLKEINKGSALKAFKKIEQLNQSISEKGSGGSVEIAFEAPVPELPPELNKLWSLFAMTDLLAMKNRKIYQNLLSVLFFLGLVVIVFFECYKHLNHEADILLWGTLGVILMAYLLAKYSHHQEFHMKFIENRVLSEALRVQFFWRLAGVEKNVEDYILRLHKAEFEWVKHLLSAINGLTYTPLQPSERFDEVKELWVQKQYLYFTGRIQDVTATQSILNKISSAGLYSAFLLLLLISVPGVKHYIEENELFHMSIVLIGALLGVFALVKGVVVKKGYHQIINQYQLTQEIFAQTIANIDLIGKKDWEAHIKSKKLRQLFYLAGREALIEIGSWYLIFKDKEPEAEMPA